MSWKPCPACLYGGAPEYVCVNREWLAACPNCRYVMVRGQSRTEIAMEYTRKFREVSQ